MKQFAWPSCAGFWRVLFGWAFLAGGLAAAAVTTNIFSTQFEASEGYNQAYDLVGQNGWFGEGSGGNGLVTNFIVGQGQQAYIGYSAPDPGDAQLVVWKPINFNPVSSNLPLVTFSVLMSIVDSSSTNRDEFRWSVYNIQGERLFTVDFDNADLGIYYRLDGTNEFEWTGYTFANDGAYLLSVEMNFESNLWNSALNGVLLASNKPITTAHAALNLGDVDAAWVLARANKPGDNFLLFDNYQITAEFLQPPRPALHWLRRTREGQVVLRLTGQSGARFAIDATTNLTTWTPLKTNVITDGYFDYEDSGTAGLSRRFYRTRWVP